jgi:site-specific recombinase XerD
MNWQKPFVRPVLKAAGMDDLVCHDLRHEGISRLFERGWQIQQVAIISGHKTWKTLQRYTHVSAESLPD